jgi:hypothetical protein
MAFTSPGMLDQTAEAVAGTVVGSAGPGSAVAGASVAGASARAAPQWHTPTRSGTRRPQVQVQLSCFVSPTPQC